MIEESWKNLGDQAQSARSKSVDSDIELKTIESNRVKTFREYQVSSVSHSQVWFVTSTILAKTFGGA